MADKDKIITLWERAAKGEPVVLSFPDKRQRERARFMLYSPFKTTTDPHLRELKGMCEVVADKDAGTLTIQLKSSNPFHELMDNELDRVLNAIQEDKGEDKGEGVFDAEGSLRRLQKKLKEDVRGTERPSNPYFDRG